MSTKNSSNAGGAAAHAGVDFQQRLAAWFAAAMLTQLDISPTLHAPMTVLIEHIAMETADCVDDIVLHCKNDIRVFVQAKTSPSLSSDPDSEFYGAIKQCIAQYLKPESASDIYVFAVSPSSSGKIRYQLRKLLSAIRYSPRYWSTAPVSEIENEVLSAFRQVVGGIATELTGKTWQEEDVVKFAQQLFVVTFDFDDSGSDSRSAYILLSTIISLNSPPDLVWSKLIQICLDASKRRLRISREGLVAILARFISEERNVESPSETSVELTQTGEIAAGMEIVLMSHPDMPGKLFVFGMRRFDDGGQARIVFSKGKCVIASGEFTVIFRAATVQGVERYMSAHANEYSDKEVVVAMANLDEDPNLSEPARARAKWVKARAKGFEKTLECLECGSAIDARVALFVEVDEQDHEHEVGVVHERCARPLHRVLGQIKRPFFDEHRHLEGFDVSRWVNQLRNGQAVLAGLQKARDPGSAVIVWNPEPAETSTRYCVRVTLESGARPTILRRGKVHRFSREEATAAATKINDLIARTLRSGDLCMMSEDGSTFGAKSVLGMKLNNEAVSRCLSADAELYTRTLAEQFEISSSYYAPLIAIRVGDGETYFRLHGACVLLSDVLEVEAHFTNWASAGVILPEHYLEMIADDHAFDVLMSRNDADGYNAIIDPMLSVDGSPLSGIPVVPITKMPRKA